MGDTTPVGKTVIGSRRHREQMAELNADSGFGKAGDGSHMVRAPWSRKLSSEQTLHYGGEGSCLLRFNSRELC